MMILKAMRGMNNVYNYYRNYPFDYWYNTTIYDLDDMYNFYQMYTYPYKYYMPMYNTNFSKQFTNMYTPYSGKIQYEPSNDISLPIKDYGPEPYVVNIEEATKQNNYFRNALWTGENLQVTLMSIDVGEDIGLEVHPDVDQFIRIEEGEGLVRMGNSRDDLDFQEKVYDDYAIMVPAGKWHNLINTGNKPLKLYSIYAPPEHPRGTVHETKEIAEAEEEKYGH